jgi:hypothetical protein
VTICWKRFHEYAQDMKSYFDSVEEIESDEENAYDWASEITDKHNALARRFNRVTGYLRERGRPLAASEAQIETVLTMHKKKLSLRAIAEHTNLGLRTCAPLSSA